MTEASYEEIKATALAALANEDKDVAFQTLRHAIQYGSPVMSGDADQFADAMAVFFRVAEQFENEAFTAKVQAVAQQPEDVQSLYDLGYALYEESLFGVAAAILSRADELAPGQPGIVSEFVCALESHGLNRDAVTVLDRYPHLADEHYLFAYLSAFNRLMAGDIATAKQAAQTLPGLEVEEAHPFMTARIAGFLDRANTIKNVSSLDQHDLRGWHYVTSGGVLTMLSPYGFPTPMSGRFGYLQDSFENCKQGLLNLQTVVTSKNLQPQFVFALPGRDSEILAIAAGKFFSLPVRSWSEAESESPGIIVAYDLGEVDVEPDSIARHRPHQLLYSHAVGWTFALPIAPDVTTLLYQMLVAPWGPKTGFDSETQQITTGQADSRAPHLIAEEILTCQPEAIEATAADELPPKLTVDFLDAIGPFPPESGSREQIWTCSPVKSARFT